MLIFHKSHGKITGWGGTVTTTIIIVWWTEGGKSHEFQQSKCRHSGIGEKETQTQSVVGKNTTGSAHALEGPTSIQTFD